MSSPPRDEGYLGRVQRAVFSLGTFGAAVPGTLTVQLQLFYTNHLGYPAMVLGNVRSAAMAFDALADPLMGYISDRTRSRFGRRMPYIAAGAVVLALAFAAMWFAPRGMSLTRIYLYLAAVQILYSIGVTMTDVPYRALIPELAKGYSARNSLVAWMQVGTYLGTVLGGAVRYYTDQREDSAQGFREYALMGSLLMVGCLWAVALLIKEPPEDRAEQPRATGPPLPLKTYLAQHLAGIFRALSFALRDRHFLLLFFAVFTYQAGVLAGLWMYPYILQDWFGQTWDSPFARKWLPGLFRDAFFLWVFFAIGCGTLFLPFWNWAGRYLEKRTCLAVGILGVGATYGASYFLFEPRSYPLLLVYCVATGFFYTAANIFPASMLADIASHSEWRRGEANEGMFYGASSFLTKAYNAVSIWWNAFALDHIVRYQTGEGAVQTAETLWRMRVLYAVPPLVAAGVAVMFLWPYALNRARMGVVTGELETRRKG